VKFKNKNCITLVSFRKWEIKVKKWHFIGLLAILALLIVGCNLKEGKNFVKIGTGSQVGVYYSAGLELARLVNKKTSEHRIDIAVESTAGSVFNVNSVISGQLEFGFTQADRQYQAYYGKGIWEAQPQTNLRFVCSFHPEMVTLVASEESGIQTLENLKNNTVSLGAYGSGTRGNALEILRFIGLEEEVDYNAEALKASEASLMLQDRRIDAFFYTVGHPNGSISEVTNGKRRVRFIPIEKVDTLLQTKPYFIKQKIPIKYYPRSLNRKDVPTIGMLTTLVTSSEVSEEVVYQVTKNLFENLEVFKKRHPAFKNLSPEGMLQGAFAPIHRGAMRYYREKGLTL